MKTIRARSSFIGLLAIISIALLLPRATTQRSYDPETGLVRDTIVRRVPIELGLDLRGGTHFALEVDESKGKVDNCKDAIQRAERVVRSRISEFGTIEPLIQIAGDCRLIVNLPGELDPERARSIVQRTAYLEFRLVESRVSLAALITALNDTAYIPRAVPGQLPGEVLVAEAAVTEVQRLLESPQVRQTLPRTTELRWSTNTVAAGRQQYRALYAVQPRAVVTGEQLVAATAARDPMTAAPQVQFELTRAAGRRFEDATSKNVGQYLAILLDGRVQGGPAMIREAIGNTGRIELGGRELQEASDLALVLRAGALPVPLRIVEQGEVGPSLGADSIEAGVRTALIAVALVVLIMTLYYRWAGIMAVGALLLYLLYSLGGLAAIGFTLTLPGLAGFALAIGMAVDANVLIFERIREELQRGRKTGAAVDAGFRNAMSAVVDSNITTALTALILFLIGTEAVQGFAVTLLIGVGASMLSAIFVTRTFFLIWLRRSSARALQFRQLTRLTSSRFDFMRVSRRVYLTSCTVIALGIGIMALRGMSYGIDFTGGVLMRIETTAPTAIADVRNALTTRGLNSAEIQSYGSNREFVIRTRGQENTANAATVDVVRDQVRRALDSELGGDAFRIVHGEGVGPEVGSEMQRKALLAIGASFATTLAYLAVRFESRFGVAAVVATAHDVLATLAFMRFLDLEITLVTVAAVLTVLGYSLNDTIVIFDRLREKLRVRHDTPLPDVLNSAINETLPRTLLTGGVTFLVALLLATFAGDVIRPFGLVMSFGIAVGTLSSVFVAAPVLQRLHTRARPPAATSH